MVTPRLGVATGNRLGTEAAAEVARAGGNAVDACLAAAIMGWVAEPFFASAGGSGFITVRTPDGVTEVIDGNVTMPLSMPDQPGVGTDRVYLHYSDGMHTVIGAGSVGVPGVVAAVRRAWERHGRIEWVALFDKAIEAARNGLVFPKTSGYYLSVTWEAIWSRSDATRSLFGVDGAPVKEGDLFKQPELAESLAEIAATDAETFYRGEIALAMDGLIRAGDGFMTLEDLDAYTAEVRAPLSADALSWRIETNPPPSVGGAVLLHMLALIEDQALEDPVARLEAIVEAQRAAMGYRRERYQDPSGIAAAFDEALQQVRRFRKPASTTHSSCADRDGYVCSITESNGYGAGLAVRGILLNNTLGEEELNPLGLHHLPPGARCHSNMTPTVVSNDDVTVALGSPGADRIVGAIAQTFVRLAVDGDDLAAAVSAPRAHIDPRAEGETLCYEPGLPGNHLPYLERSYDELHMYFGAVQAASVTSDGRVDAAHDPRRSGGSALV